MAEGRSKDPGAHAVAPPRRFQALVVDDEAPVRISVARTLKALRCDAIEASGPTQALALIDSGLAPDLVISDYRMPDGDGVTLLRVLQERAPAAQRIMISGHADLASLQGAINDGTVHRFLTKPWEIETFISTIRSAIEQVLLTEERDALVRELRDRQGELEEITAELEARVGERTAQLEGAKKAWERTFDVFAEPLQIVDGRHRVERANLAFAVASGRNIRSVPGSRCHETLFGRSEPCPGCPLLAVGAEGAPETAEIEDTRRDRIYESSAYLFQTPDEAGGIPRYVVMYKDITERKRLAQQLIQSEKMAALGLLSGEIAHEINNPVGIILSFSQLALRLPDLAAEGNLREFLGQIESSARRCKSIIQNLLSFSRPSRHAARGALDISEIVGRTLEIAGAQLRGSGVKVSVEMADDLPTVVGQPDQIQQVLLNLVTNAADALADRAGDRWIRVRAFEAQLRHRDHVVIEVADSGPGLPEDNRSRVFDPFFTTKPVGKGTGLGLSICYRIVHDHAGHIEASNIPSAGAVFRVWLPAGVEPGSSGS